MEKQNKINIDVSYPHCVICGKKIWFEPGELISRCAYEWINRLCNVCLYDIPKEIQSKVF